MVKSDSELSEASAFIKRLEEELDQEIQDFLSAIFGNKTWIYKRLSGKRGGQELGKLLVIDEYLNRNEVELVK